MDYFFDTEFLEGKQDKRFLGIKYGETKPTIDLISIGIVCEDGREYYAISKDFNLYEAWNRHEDKIDIMSGNARNLFPEGRKYKEYWMRENVLKSIFYELVSKYALLEDKAIQLRSTSGYNPPYKFDYKTLKKLILLFGKTNKEITEEIKLFTMQYSSDIKTIWDKPKFYAYYADYDWVVFCQLFGTMMDLPNYYPMYCNDLKQTYDEKEKRQLLDYKHLGDNAPKLKQHVEYPEQENEHNALDDARWNLRLYNFLKRIR